MRIQKLKILGFKSFAQKTEVQFEGNGLTAIVGPNGCGKSNIVDAIRWVMGEQRAGMLRMDKMQGVIFSGTEERPAMNMAEVSLLIENDRGLLPSEYNEVMITRRAFANGESQYSINNQECRLADIKNLFADTGMGAGSYSQMDQRMVDALLSDKADERRTIFEEAAGVSKYKKQRKEAVSQLERVQTDMERVATELQYARNQFRQQERMLGRVQELRKLKSRLKELDVSISINKYEEGKISLSNLSSAKIKSETELGAFKTRLTELETRIEEKRLSISNDEENLRELEQEVSKIQTELARLNEAYTHLRNNEKTLDENRERCEIEIEINTQKQNSLNEEILLLERDIETLNPEIEDLENRGKYETEILQVGRNALDDLAAKHRELSNRRLQLVQECGKLQNFWQRTDTEIEILQERISRAEIDLAGFETQITEFENLEKSKENEAAAAHTALELANEQAEVLAGEREDLEIEITKLKDEQTAANSEITRLKSRLDTLQSINKNTTENSETSNFLKDEQLNSLERLGSLIELTDIKYAPLVEFCLGKATSAYVKNMGRSAHTAVTTEPPINLPLVSSFVSLATDGGKQAIETLLSNYYLVPNFDSAKDFAQKYAEKNIWFCTENCQAVNAVGLIVVAEEEKSNGILQRTAEIKELSNSLKEQEQKKLTIDSQLQNKIDKKQELTATHESIKEEKQRTERNSFTAKSDSEIAKTKKTSVQSQKEKSTLELQTAQTRLGELQNSRNADTELTNAEHELSATESAFQKTDDELKEREQIFKNQEETVAELAANLNQKKSAFVQKTNRLNSAKEQVQTLNSAVRTRIDELSGIEGKKSLLDTDLENTAAQIEKQNEILSGRESARDEAREKYQVLAGDLEEWRAEVREINRSLRDKEKNEHETDLKIQSVKNDLERIRERIFGEYEYDLEKDSTVQDFVKIQYEERTANVEIYELNEKIKQIGPVSITAAEDFEAEKERVLSIETQYNDLNKAKNSLSTAMERLDQVARDRFLDTFRKIQRNYNDIFSSLMPGGEAKLGMQSDLDPLEAEIEINARPTGKKMRGVRALSGGERALTATSLLFALYMVKPSPYCVLDEIDGPLDDSNIGRFMALLRRFSHQTQFVVITHNKRTMAAADRLYGVTQEIKGISKIGSANLGDFKE
ncbi:chromosome partition protein Smc [Fibrobacterales bacterium]|nr:chromosome partition protein Smc [Fibrobacterales bacterium]